MTIFTNLLLAGSISLIWSFVNALQMLMFIAMCQISFPSTVKMLYKILIPMASLDIIPSELSTDLIFSFSDDKDYSFNSKLEELGFENHNTIQNLGSMFYFILISLIMMLISLLMKRCKCKNEIYKKIKKHF